MEDQNRDVSRMIADNLIHFRYRIGGTQASVARELGLPRSTMNLLESGLGNPSIALVAKMARHCKVRVDDLLQDPFDHKRVVYRRGNLIFGMAATGVSVGQVRSHRSRIRLREFLCKEESRTIRLMPQARGTQELLICYEGEVGVWSPFQSVQAKAGEMLELVPFVEKKIVILQVPMRATLLQIKN